MFKNRWRIVLLLLFALLATVAYSQVSPNGVALRSFVLDDFDQLASDWLLRYSRGAKSSYFSASLDANGEALREVPALPVGAAGPEALYSYEEKQNKSVLGIRGGFDLRGYNFIEILPPTRVIQLQSQTSENGDSLIRKRSLPIPGIAQTIELWVWSDNRNYSIEAHFEDYRGFTSVLPLGNIGHRGWNKISARIPNWIPQRTLLSRRTPTADELALIETSGNPLPDVLANQYYSLELERLILWTNPGERVDEFFVYLDELIVISDIYRTRFDGQDLADPSRIQEIWGGQ